MFPEIMYVFAVEKKLIRRKSNPIESHWEIGLISYIRIQLGKKKRL